MSQLWLPGYHLGLDARRPDEFLLNKDSSLATGLCFAGLGLFTGSTRYQDSSLYESNGTLTNMDPATDWVFDAELGRWGNNYTGTTAGISLGTAINSQLSSDYSLSFWARKTSTSFDGTVLGVQRAAWNANVLRFNTHTVVYLNGEASSPFWTVSDARVLAHYTLVNNASVPTLYQNGVSLGAKANAGVVWDEPFWIGQNADLGIASFVGFLSDIVIHSRALSLPEIRTLANRSDPMLGGLIQPIGPRLLPVAVAGTTPTFSPAWARYANTLIGGGIA